ncbi:MAG: hypothetical protein ACYDCH_15395 [Gaiellaceae bacterium]
MGSRLPPLSFALGAVLADAAGSHRLAFYLVLIAIPCAAGAAFLGAGDVLEGKPAWLRGLTSGVALVLLVVASAVREHAAHGAAVPTLAVSGAVGAVLVYSLPALAWVLEPVVPRPPRRRAVRIRPATEP